MNGTTCPTCGWKTETEGTICWKCGAPIRGQSRGKHVEGTRDVLQSLKDEKWRCVDGILKMYPCDKCGRSELESAAYRHSTEEHVKQLLLEAGVTNNPKDALATARLILEKQQPQSH